MAITDPIDVPTTETVRFIRAHASSGSRVLEVGCGAGHVASTLAAEGYDVVAIDASEKAIERARTRGVDARHADWLEFDDDPFDAIVFTRSLHHIFPLDPAVERTRHLLTDGGCVLAEEFAREVFDEPTATWLTGRAAHLHDDGVLDGDAESLPREMLAASDPLATWKAWHGGHHHELHSADQIEKSLAEHGYEVAVEPAPYLYRYFGSCLSRDRDGVSTLRGLLAGEAEVIDAGAIRPIGRRFVAR